jgi:hypothetical protein
MAYSTLDILFIEDYILFDGFAIVAAVGGSMGLFLGFSFFNCLLRMWAYLGRIFTSSRLQLEQ